MRVRVSSLLVAGLALLWLLAATVSRSVAFAYRAPDLRIALETAATLTAVLIAFLVIGRVREGSAERDPLVGYAFVVLAIGNLAFTALPAVASGGNVDDLSARLRVASGLVGGLSLCLAGAAPRWIESLRHHRGATAALAVLLPVLVFDVTLLAGDPAAPVVPPVDSARGSYLVGSAGFLLLQLMASLAFALASGVFSLRAERSRDVFIGTIAVSSAIAAVARLAYFLFPSFPRDWVHIGDLLRLLSYAVLLAGVFSEISRYRQAHAAAAVSEERRRIARELHDGMAQELAFMATQARRAAMSAAARGQKRPEPDIPLLRQIASAAERALDESRRALAALAQPVETLDAAIAQTVEAVAGRRGARVELDLAQGVRLPPATREDLLRIIREAASNATRHGGADRVKVTLEAVDGHARVVVADDGAGFNADQLGTTGFGLVSMRERAATHGGAVTVRSVPGEGTEVEVVLPSAK